MPLMSAPADCTIDVALENFLLSCHGKKKDSSKTFELKKFFDSSFCRTIGRLFAKIVDNRMILETIYFQRWSFTFIHLHCVRSTLQGASDNQVL